MVCNYQFCVGQDFQQRNEFNAILQVFDQVIHSKRWNSLQEITKENIRNSPAL